MDVGQFPLVTRLSTSGPEWIAGTEGVARAMRLTAELNTLTLNDATRIRELFSALTGQCVDETFSLIPPFYTSGGNRIRAMTWAA